MAKPRDGFRKIHRVGKSKQDLINTSYFVGDFDDEDYEDENYDEYDDYDEEDC